MLVHLKAHHWYVFAQNVLYFDFFSNILVVLQVRNDDNIMAPQPASGDLFPEPPIKIRDEDLFNPPTKIVDPPLKVND